MQIFDNIPSVTTSSCFKTTKVTVLTILHPEVMPLIKHLSYGLLPLRLKADQPFSLIIKMQKEAILAARLNSGFSFYLPLMPFSKGFTIALISAFFDDEDEPLVIRTPLYGNSDPSKALLEILSYDEVDIYFFDELNFEWMSYRTSLEDGGSCLLTEEEFFLLSYHSETSKSVHRAMTSWFGQRTSDDDERAIKAVFKNKLSVGDFAILDMMPETNSYQGSSGFRFDQLTRTDPGYFQERDISACLLRAFTPESIMMNPRRKDTSKEILDHLVLTDRVALLIQAKDGPTTEASMRRTLLRKRQGTHGQIKKGIRQINGAIRYLNRNELAKLTVGDKDVEISIGQRQTLGLVIVKELFEDEADAYTAASNEFAGLSSGGILMDYSSFHALTHHFSSSEGLLGVLSEIIARSSTAGWIPVKDIAFDGVLDLIDSVKKSS